MENTKNTPEQTGGGEHVFLPALLDVVVAASSHYLGLRETGVTPSRMNDTLGALTDALEVLGTVFRVTGGGRCARCGEGIGSDGVGEWDAFCADCAGTSLGALDELEAARLDVARCAETLAVWACHLLIQSRDMTPADAEGWLLESGETVGAVRLALCSLVDIPETDTPHPFGDALNR